MNVMSGSGRIIFFLLWRTCVRDVCGWQSSIHDIVKVTKRMNTNLLKFHKVNDCACTYTWEDVYRNAYRELFQTFASGFPNGTSIHTSTSHQCIEVTVPDPYPIVFVFTESVINLEKVINWNASLDEPFIQELTGNELYLQIYKTMIPCWGEVCCEYWFYVYTQSQQLDGFTYWNPGASHQEPCPPGTRNCDPACSYHEVAWYRQGFNPPKAPTILEPQFNGNTRPDANNTSSVSPNPSNGLFDIYLKSEIEGEIEFQISNAKGEIVKYVVLNKKGLELNQRINLSEVSSGKYFYNFYRDGQLINSGSFLIAK